MQDLSSKASPLVSFPLPLRSRREGSSSCPSLRLGEEQSRTEPEVMMGFTTRLLLPSSGADMQQGLVRTPGVRNQGQRVMILNTLFYRQNSFSLSLIIA